MNLIALQDIKNELLETHRRDLAAIDYLMARGGLNAEAPTPPVPLPAKAGVPALPPAKAPARRAPASPPSPASHAGGPFSPIKLMQLALGRLTGSFGSVELRAEMRKHAPPNTPQSTYGNSGVFLKRAAQRGQLVAEPDGRYRHATSPGPKPSTANPPPSTTPSEFNLEAILPVLEPGFSGQQVHDKIKELYPNLPELDVPSARQIQGALRFQARNGKLNCLTPGTPGKPSTFSLL